MKNYTSMFISYYLRTMKKLSLLFLFILPLFVQAQENTSIQLDDALLWEISGNNLKSPSYLFGTMHIMPAGEFFFPQRTLDKLKKCKILALEIDINIPLKEQIKLAQEILLPKGKTVQNYLNDKEYKLFKSYLRDTLDISKKKYNKYIRFKPFYIYSILLANEIGKVKSYEKELNKVAKQKGIKTIGLESIQFQMALVDSIPIKKQALSILGGDIKAEFDKMLTIYKKQNLSALFRLISAESDFDEMEKDMLQKRNEKWIPIIEKLISKKPAFIAVGAGHIAGALGIINQLRQKGYTVKAVK